MPRSRPRPGPSDNRGRRDCCAPQRPTGRSDRKSTRLNSSHGYISDAVFCLKKKSNLKTNKRKSKHSAMLRNDETRHRLFIGLLNTTQKLAQLLLFSSFTTITRCPEITAHVN